MSWAEMVVRADVLAHRHERFIPKRIVFFLCERVEALPWNDFWDAQKETSGTQATPVFGGNPTVDQDATRST